MSPDPVLMLGIAIGWVFCAVLLSIVIGVVLVFL